MRVACLICACLVLSALGVLAQHSATPQLILNGGFERGQGARAADWGVWPPAGRDKGVSSVRDPEVKRRGEYSGRLRITAQDFSGIATWHHNNIAVLPGQELVLRAWIKCESATECGIDVQLRADATKIVGSRAMPSLSGTRDWRQYEHRFTIPQGVEFIAVVPLLRHRGTAWFDDIELFGTPTMKSLAAAAPPQVDGRLDDPLWSSPPSATGFLTTEGEKPRSATEAWVASDAEHLYVAVKCHKLPGDELKATVKKRDGDVWTDDDVEVFLCPAGDFTDYYQFIVNPLGTKYDSHGTSRSWSIEWEAAAQATPQAWTVEIAIPFKELPLDLNIGTEWCLNIGRADKANGEASSWSCTFGGFHNAGRFGRILGLQGDFTPFYAEHAGTELRSVQADFNRVAGKLDLNGAPAQLAGNVGAEIQRLRRELTDLEAKLRQPAKLARADWEALRNRLAALGDDVDALAPRTLRLNVRALWKKKLGREPDYGAVLELPAQKVFPDGQGLRGLVSDRIELSAARNEYESVQIVIVPLRQAPEVRDVTCSDLIGPGKIPAANVTWRIVGCVTTHKPKYPTIRVGEWPDSLLPAQPAKVPQDRVQPLWVTVYVPPEAKSGAYAGKLRVLSDSHPLEFDLALRVYDFALPKRGHLATPFGCSPDRISLFYYGDANYTEKLPPEVYQRWCKFMLDYRLSPTNLGQAYVTKKRQPDGTIKWDFTRHDQIFAPLVERIPLHAINLGGVGHFGWRGVRGASASPSTEPHSGRGARLVTMPQTKSWALVQRSVDGAWLAKAKPSAVSFWVRATDAAFAQRRCSVALNCFPKRWFSSFAVGSADWHQVRIPLQSFHLGEQPMALEDLAICYNFQIIIGKTDAPFSFLLDDFCFETPGGPLVVDDFEGTREQEQIAQDVGAKFRHWKRQGWLPIAHVYGWDEVQPQDYEAVVEAYRMVLRDVPQARIMQTYYRNKTPHELTDTVSIWCPITSIYDRAFCEGRRARGEDIWLYVCCGPTPPYANFFIDEPAVDHRVLFWQAWQANAVGFLYWQTNWWFGNMPDKVSAPHFPDVPWNMDCGTYRDHGVNGDGWLLYPGKDQQPLASLRLENIRDGIEDYEYLWLLRQRLSAARKSDRIQPADLARAQALLNPVPEITRSFTDYTKDPRVILARRAAIAEMIEKLH